MSSSNEITFIDPVTGLPEGGTKDESDLLFGSGTLAQRPASGLATGDLWALVEGINIRLTRWNGATWDEYTVQPSAAGSVDNRFPRFDGVTGAILQNSLVGADDSGHLNPAGAGQDIGPGADWRRIYALHSVHGVDVFNSASSLDDAKHVVAQNGTYTLTLPTAATGWSYTIERQGSSGTVSLAPGGGDTINGAGTVVLEGDGVYLVYAEDATDWRFIKVGIVGGSTPGATLSNVFSAYNSGGQTFTTIQTTMLLSTEQFASGADFTFAANQVALNAAGRYLIHWSSTFRVTNNNRGSVRCWLELNAGTLPGTESYAYYNQANNGGTAAGTIIDDFSADDVIRVRGVRANGTGTVRQEANGTRLTIIRLS